MPVWIQYVVWAAAFLTATTIILGFPFIVWRKVVKPFSKLINTTQEMLPLLKRLTEEFKDAPDAFVRLKYMQDQFRSDHGSTLKDQINRLEASTEKLETAAKIQEQNVVTLKIASEVAAQRASDESEQTQRLVLALDRVAVKLDALTVRVNETVATGDRIERHASEVAIDLAQAHKRADEVSDSRAGAAADASAQISSKEERDITKDR